MTSQPTSDTSILSIGDPILNSTAILRHSILDDTGLPFPSFLTNPDESDDEDTSQPTIPNIYDYQLPSFLLSTSTASTQSLHISALRFDDTLAAVPPPPVTTPAPTPPPTPTSPLTAALAAAITTTASTQATSSSSSVEPPIPTDPSDRWQLDFDLMVYNHWILPGVQ